MQILLLQTTAQKSDLNSKGLCCVSVHVFLTNCVIDTQ